MENIQTIRVNKQPINCYLTQRGLITTYWGSNLDFQENNENVTPFSNCIDCLPMRNYRYAVLTLKNMIFVLDENKNSKWIDFTDSPYLVYGLNQNTELFMHNTIEQQDFLCLLNLYSQQKQKYQHNYPISSICPLQEGLIIGDKKGYISKITHELLLLSRVKGIFDFQLVFNEPIAFIKQSGERVFIFSLNKMKIMKREKLIKQMIFPSEVSFVTIHNKIVYIGTIDGKLIVIKRDFSMKSDQIHDNPINCISFMEDRMVTCSSDKTIKIWLINE